MTDLDALERLLAEATPGPWHSWPTMRLITTDYGTKTTVADLPPRPSNPAQSDRDAALIVSGRDAVEDTRTAERLGAHAFLTLPIDLERLVACVDELRARHGRGPAPS